MEININSRINVEYGDRSATYRLKSDLLCNVITINSRIRQLQQEIENKSKELEQLERAVENFDSLPDIIPQTDFIHMDNELQQFYWIIQNNRHRENAIHSSQQMTIPDNVQYETTIISTNTESMEQNATDTTRDDTQIDFSFDHNSYDVADYDDHMDLPETSDRPLIEITSSMEQIIDPKKRRICDNCGKAFRDTYHLERHQRVHSNERPFKCDYCDQRFKYDTDFRNHVAIHTNEQPFKCEQCNKGFFRRQQLTEHMRKHTGERPFKCDQCEKTFRSKTGIRRHRCKEVDLSNNSNDTINEPNFYSCSQCDQKFDSFAERRDHVRTHPPIEYPCPNCNRIFKNKSGVKTHLRTQTCHIPY
ncbi:hypothetical protein RDWZM_010566 [Blomia tropicalis]|uniref:C2H2-type domain-containing protein n=1 Tax=Blomia tropicalis TaxID=40697 RepID=A0A9Q0RIW4_BLOTA|nr:hypothetical protein RDWZM_010566 [Blomia tropicalis]